MKLVCVNFHLKEALLLSERISGKNLTLPILSAVLLLAKNNELKITATNLEIGLEITIPAKIEKGGEIAVLAKTLNNLISGFSDENISFEAQNGNLAVTTKHSSSIIKGYSAEDFPAFPSVQEKHSFSLPAPELISGLKTVWHAASLSDIKPEIASIFVSSQKNQPLLFAATDSFRLAEKVFSGDFSFFPYLLMPQRSVGEIIRIFDNKNTDVRFSTDKNQLVMTCENIKFISRLIEGNFPDYKQIIPKDYSTEVEIEKEVFSNALKTASVFSSRLNELKFRVYPDDKLFEIETANSDLGEHTTHLPADIKGERVEVAFNHKYLLEGLQFINSKKVLLRFNGAEKPLVVRGAEDNSYYYLVMPMKNI